MAENPVVKSTLSPKLDSSITPSFLPLRQRLEEFRINQPPYVGTLSTSPTVMAAVVVNVATPNQRVWLNGTVSWAFSFNGTGTANVLFEILRQDTVIYSCVQSIAGTSLVMGLQVYNQVQLQHVDLTPTATPTSVPVLYKLRGTVVTAPPGSALPSRPILSAARIVGRPVI